MDPSFSLKPTRASSHMSDRRRVKIIQLTLTPPRNENFITLRTSYVSLPSSFLSSIAKCNNNFTAGGKRNKSQDNKDCHGHQQEACVAPGNLHWPPILTPRNFSNAANVGYGERTDSELSDLHRETNSLRGIPTPVIGAIQNATSNSLPGLQALPVPPLYQCLSCGQLNPVVSFPRAENDEDVPYFLASSVGRNDPQGK